MSDFDNLTIIDKLNITLSNLNMSHLIGKIKMYAGTSLPAGYVWCDGTGGTPDLTSNQYIISDQSDGTQQQTGNNYFTNNMISHNHNISNNSSLPTGHNINFSNGAFTIANIRDVYNDLSGIYVYKPRGNETETKSPNSGSKNISKNGPYDRDNSHHHELDNSPSPGISSTIIHYMNSKSQFEESNNLTVGQEGNGATYEPPYIYIGFIMKDPSTWL